MTDRVLTKLMIIDDDLDILKIVEFSLESMTGVTVKYCSSGQEGIREALIFLPDLMLIDVMMPEMSGFAMVAAMRLIPSLTKVPVIFFTAKIQKEEIEECYQVGAKDVIPKPFDPLTLPDLILEKWNKIQSH